MTVTDQLLANSETYASSFDKGELAMPPASHVAVLACMDARLNPYGILGLSEGAAHIIRNAAAWRPTTPSGRSPSRSAFSAPPRSS